MSSFFNEANTETLNLFSKLKASHIFIKNWFMNYNTCLRRNEINL